MMKYFEKSRTSTSYSWLMKESEKEDRNMLAKEGNKKEKSKIEEDSNDDSEEEEEMREKDSHRTPRDA